MKKNPEKLRLADYVETFTSVSGEKVLRDMHRSYCGTSFHANALEMARREGRREVVLSILRLIGQSERLFEVEHKEEDE